MNSPTPSLPLDPGILQCSNCTLAAAWFANVFAGGLDDVGMVSTVSYIRDCISHYLNASNTPAPSDIQIISWFIDTGSWSPKTKTVAEILVDFAKNQCIDEMCSKFAWRGDADIAGGGMLVTYYLQAFLTLIYALSNIKALATPKSLSRWRLSFQHSSRTFLESSTIYSAGMLVAALVNLARGLADSTMSRSIFSLFATTLASLICVLSTFLAYVFMRGNLHRTKWVIGRTIILVLLAWVVSIISLVVFGPTYKHYIAMGAAHFEGALFWEASCGTKWLQLLIFDSVVTIGIFGFAALCLLNLRPRKQSSYNTLFTYVCACLSIIGSWGSLILFTYVVYQANTASGASTEQTQWTFGQVLALATWVPVLVDFAYVFFEGPQEAYTGQMAEPFCATTTTSTPTPGLETEQNTEPATLNGETQAFLETRPEEHGGEDIGAERQANMKKGLRMNTV